MKISLVVPCYNEQLTVEKFYAAALPVLKDMKIDYEIIFVNDGSSDDTQNILAALAQKDKAVKVASFSKNFGQQAAILCGFRLSSGDCVVELDCDLQDPIELLPTMYQKFSEGYDVVHGRRTKRKGESLFKRATASIYYKFLSKISTAEVPRNTGDFKLLSRRVVDIVCNMTEHDKYLRGLESWVGFKQTFVDFERAERVAGETHYTLKKMIKLATSGIMANSVWPLTLPMKFGVATGVLSILGFIALIILAAANVAFDAALWLLPTMVLLFSATFIFSGLTNLYIAAIYGEAKNRPEYIIEKTINVDKE